MRTVDDMVRMEVHYCVSSLVSTLAQAYGCGFGQLSDDIAGKNAGELFEQAAELCSPLLDYEEAAIQEGWIVKDGRFVHKDAEEESGTTAEPEDACGWQTLCDQAGIEPYDREVFEHWIVSDWLADKLAEQGEKVDKDFAGLTVWARTTTGQGIASDSVIERIYAETHRE